MSGRNIFICPKCKRADRIISNIYVNSGKIKFNCKDAHEETLENYLEYLHNLKKDENKSSSKDSLIDGEIETKMNSISDMIRVITILLETQFNHPNYYMNTKSIINIGKYIVNGKDFPSDIDDAINEIYSETNKEAEKNAIEELAGKKYCVGVKNKEKDEKKEKSLNEETNLVIKGKYEIKDGKKVSAKLKENGIEVDACIGDTGFELLSRIIFKDLIEINLSCNGITTAKYLNDMNLPHLEILDLSDNQINDAKPIANLKSRYLKMIFLQENIIETLKDFNDKKVKFKELEILRVDKNKLDLNDIEFKKAKKKFGRKLIYETISPESFGKKYEVNLKEGETKLDLSGKKRKELLIDLINIIGQLLSLNSLYLDNNNIDNPTILGNIPLYNLKILDLSLNKITNIFFLRKLSKKCGDLEELYLNDNKIADITPFQSFPEKKYEISFGKLKILTLKNNLFYDRRTNRCCRCFGCCSFWNSCYCDNCRDYCRNKKKKTRSDKTIISIKDIKTREVFKSIIKRFRTDFGDSENIIIKEERKEIEANIENDLISNEVNTDTNSNINANNNGN